MMRRLLLILSISAAAFLASAGSATYVRCSMAVGAPLRQSGTSVLLATAMRDTVLAGPGGREASTLGGHSGSGAPGPFYGQVMEVQRVGGFGSDRVEAALERSGTARVIVVPWDYDPACRPTRWTRSAAWVTATEPGMYTLTLRPDSLWIDGVPVYDALVAEFEPYPHARVYGPEGRYYMGPPHPRPWLDAAEAFQLAATMPAYDSIAVNPDSMWRAFSQWAEEHPQLLDRWPGSAVMDRVASYVSRTKDDHVLRAIDPVVAGTWRMAVSLSGGAEHTYYLRTQDRALLPWLEGERPSRAAPEEEPARPDGYLVQSMIAATRDGLPVGCESSGVLAGGYLHVLDPPPFAGRTQWDGWVDARLLAAPGDSAFRQFGIRALRERGDRRRATGVTREAPARFTLGDDGVLRVEQTLRLNDGTEVRLRGERISRQTFVCG